MNHLKNVGESYLKHLFEAWYIVLTLILASFICLIHSFFPFMFERTASNMLKNIFDRTERRNSK
jgi:hypothetical protein